MPTTQQKTFGGRASSGPAGGGSLFVRGTEARGERAEMKWNGIRAKVNVAVVFRHG